MKVLVVGRASLDTYLSIDGFIKEKMRASIKGKLECPSGSAFVSASLLSLWGEESYFNGVIGRDDAGNKILRYAKNIELNTDYLLTSNIETTKNFVLLNRYNSSNSLLTNIVKDDTSSVDINIKPNIILMDSEEYYLSKNAIEAFPCSTKIMNLYNINENTLKLCKQCDYIICSKEFAELISKERINYSSPETLKKVLNLLCNTYNSEVIITLGNKGCLYRVDDKIKIMGAIKVMNKDETGARDIFAGAFAYGIGKGLPIEKCLKIAIVASGLSVKTVGSTTSIPDITEVYKIYEKNR